MNATPGKRTGSRFVEKGKIYVIADVDQDGDLFLVGDLEPFAWYSWRFRKLADIKAENAMKRKALAPLHNAKITSPKPRQQSRKTRCGG